MRIFAPDKANIHFFIYRSMAKQVNFKSFKLHEKLLQAIDDNDFKHLTPVQEKSLPVAMRGVDVRVIAQTGSGKTVAYALPILNKLLKNFKKSASPKALVLVPTRELAQQVAVHIRDLTVYTDITVVSLFGGVKIEPQLSKLNKGGDIVVATPGRLLDICKNYDQRLLRNVKHLVLDEADKILDMGFAIQLKEVVRFLPPHRQNLLFSATFSKELKYIASKLQRSPVTIELQAEKSVSNKIEQMLFHVSLQRKASFLFHYIVKNKVSQALVFCRTKAVTDTLAKYLGERGIASAALHSDKNQAQRSKILASLKSGKIKILVATDVAARGIDIKMLPLVVNYELPTEGDDYTHRIGRTGRAGASGVAISLVSSQEMRLVSAIERQNKTVIKRVNVPDYESDNVYIASNIPSVSSPKSKKKNIAVKRNKPVKKKK